LQWHPSVLSIVATLALLAVNSPPLALALGRERFPLPLPAAGVRLEPRALERRIDLHVPAGRAAAVAARLRAASRLCPDVSIEGDAVALRCRSARIRAELDTRHPPLTLDLVEISVPLWRSFEEGPPLVPFDLARLGLEPCPGETPESRGECALAADHYDAARRLFEDALAAGGSGFASIRLGDLALRADSPDAAVGHWRRALRHAPWDRLATARLCELDAACVDSDEAKGFFDAKDVHPALQADMKLRAIRLLALSGAIVEAARSLVPEAGAGGACAGAPAWCRHLLLVALNRPGAEGADALSVYVETPGRTDGPLALELAVAAAGQAEVAGAPIFGANLLASMTRQVAADALPAHLLRVVRMFLAGGDAARAEEILRFARVHVGRGDWRRLGWPAIDRTLSRGRGGGAPSAVDTSAADLASAAAAIETARLAALTRGVAP